MTADRDEVARAEELRAARSREALLEEYSSIAHAADRDAARSRRILLRALCRAVGHHVEVGPGVLVLHPETFEIGDQVSIGHGTFLQGRYDGRFVVGSRSTIGPGSYLHCVDLEIGSDVFWGAGAKALGGEHTAEPLDVPIISTDIRIGPVRVGAGAWIGASSVLLPSVVVGEGAVVRVGSVVARDVPPHAVVEGIPARIVGHRAK